MPKNTGNDNAELEGCYLVKKDLYTPAFNKRTGT